MYEKLIGVPWSYFKSMRNSFIFGLKSGGLTDRFTTAFIFFAFCHVMYPSIKDFNAGPAEKFESLPGFYCKQHGFTFCGLRAN